LGEAEKLHLQSVAAYNELAKKFPKEPWNVEASGHSYRYLGWIARDTARPAEAIDYFEKGIAVFQKLADADIPQKDGYYRDYQADTLKELALFLTAAGRPNDAEKAIRRAVELYESLMRDYPDNSKWRQKAAEAVHVVADLLIKNGRQQEAADVYRAALAAVENLADPQAIIYRGTLRRDSGKLDQAIADCSLAIAAKPDMVEAWDLRGSCYLRKGDLVKAAKDYSEAIKLQPENSWYWHERAFAYMVLGEHRESIADHSEAIRLSSDIDAGTRLRRGDCYRALGEWTKAEIDYTRAIELNSGDWDEWHGRGLTYLQLKQDKNATSDFSRAIELKPDRWEGWSGRALAYFHRQQWDNAVSDYSKAIDLAPEVQTNWLQRGQAYLNLAQWDKAAADFAKVVERWPNDPEGWYSRGVAYSQLDQPDKAVADLRQAIERGLKDAERIKSDARLAPLRSNDDFKKLLTMFEKEKQ
jgi:tetratricopeptide (TPR) repeat protein